MLCMLYKWKQRFNVIFSIKCIIKSGYMRRHSFHICWGNIYNGRLFGIISNHGGQLIILKIRKIYDRIMILILNHHICSNRRPLVYVGSIIKCNLLTHVTDEVHGILIWNYSYVNASDHFWCLVNICYAWWWRVACRLEAITWANVDPYHQATKYLPWS